MTTVTMTLTEFLTARLDEDEADARGDDGSPTPIGMWDPDRVLAEVAAKRAIVEIHYNGAPEHYTERCSPCDTVNEPCRTLLALATPYADHPDYREEWKP
jgi:hypothetical protein